MWVKIITVNFKLSRVEIIAFINNFSIFGKLYSKPRIMTIKELLVDLLKENKVFFTEHKAYVLPEIPAEKLTAIEKTHQLHETENILWAVDRTMSGNASDSTIVTNFGIYFSQTIIGQVTNKKILWSEIEQFFYDKKKGFVFINNKGEEIVFERMDFDVYYKKSTEKIDVIIKVFEQVIDFVKLNSAELPLSEVEKSFMDDVKFMLEDDGQIVDTEQRILDKMREKYKIKKVRADEIIETTMKNYASSEEMDYLTEVKNNLNDDGKIEEIERRALDFFRQKLGISEEKAMKLEKLVVK